MNTFCHRIYSNRWRQECWSKFEENPSILQKIIFSGPGVGAHFMEVSGVMVTRVVVFYGNSLTRKKQQYL